MLSQTCFHLAVMSSLEELPAEIFAQVARYVNSAGFLAPFAANSKQCQVHVESVRFHRLNITTARLPDFIRIVNGPRFLALRCLTYQIDTIEAGPGSDCAVRIALDDLHAASEAFTVAVMSLLTALKEKSESLSTKHPGIELHLSCKTRPCDHISENIITDSYAYIAHDRDDEPSYDRAWVKLLEDHIPAGLLVPAVKSFRNTGIGTNYLHHRIWPASWSALFARFPELKTVHAEVFDDERKGLRSRIEARNGKVYFTLFGIRDDH